MVWDPRSLPVQRQWFTDGPLLPVEFAGKSAKDERVTLVLLKNAPAVRTLWALMRLTNLDVARAALADREGATSRDKTRNIGFWCADSQSTGIGVPEIGEWARSVGVGGVAWADMPPKFGTEYREQLAEEVVSYLRGLLPERQKIAEQYIRRAPYQIDTPVRRAVEKEFGWTPLLASSAE